MNLSPLPIQKFFNSNGEPLVGGLLYTYTAGTTTKVATYIDSTGVGSNTNPIVLDYRGEARVWLDIAKVYKFVLSPPGDTDPPTKAIWTVDNIAAPISFSDLTQQVIGLILYPRTAAEIAATVTPTNYGYPPGNVLRYGANSTPGTTDMTTAINNALKSNNSVYAPAGIYKVTSSILVNPYNELYGDGWGANGGTGGTVFLATTDIEIIASSNANVDSLPYVHLHDFVAQCTVTNATTKYQIHLRNPNQTHLVRVKTYSGLLDTNYSTTNIAGVWLENANVAASTFILRVTGSFIQNGGLLISTAVTDGTIIDNFIYGHCASHGLRFEGAGGNWCVSGNNLTSPPSTAAVAIVGGSLNHIRIEDNFFDGNPAVLDSGIGVLVDTAPRVIISGNIFWAMSKQGVYATDPVGLIVSNNIFLNCNDGNSSYSDVVINGHAFQPSTNIVSGNWFQQETSRSNKGFAIEELNTGFNPVQNVYTGNQVSSNYLATGSYGAIKTLQGGSQAAKVTCNSGGGTDTELLGTFTGTLTGVVGTVTGSVKYTRNGNIVTLSFPTISGTSNSTGLTVTGLPTSLQTGYSDGARGSAIVTDSGAAAQGQLAVDTSGTITFYKGVASAGFTAAGTKGVVAGTSITYSLV
jgi:hypothetical protein